MRIPATSCFQWARLHDKPRMLGDVLFFGGGRRRDERPHVFTDELSV